jgi:hypothetical protein
MKAVNIVKKETGTSIFIGTGSHLLNDENLKDPKTVAISFNNLFITITEKLNIQQIEKGDAVSFLKDPLPGNFPSIKIILTNEAKSKSIIHSLK